MIKKQVEPRPRKSNAGRKWFDGKNEKEVIAKLEEVWEIGGSDAEAALHADISTFSLSRYLQAYPKISLRKEALKEKPTLTARREVVKGLQSDPEFSLKYLERKKKNEFSLRSELTGADGKPISYTDMSEEELDKKIAETQTKLKESKSKRILSEDYTNIAE